MKKFFLMFLFMWVGFVVSLQASYLDTTQVCKAFKDGIQTRGSGSKIKFLNHSYLFNNPDGQLNGLRVVNNNSNLSCRDVNGSSDVSCQSSGILGEEVSTMSLHAPHLFTMELPVKSSSEEVIFKKNLIVAHGETLTKSVQKIQIKNLKSKFNTTVTLEATDSILIEHLTLAKSATVTIKAPKVTINTIDAFQKSNLRIIADEIDMNNISLNNRAIFKVEPFTTDGTVSVRAKTLKLKKSTVFLGNGLYHIRRVELKNRSSLEVGESVQIINRRVVVLNHSRVNSLKNSSICDEENNANALFIYSNDLVRVENHSKISAHIYNERRVELIKHAGIKGAVSAKNRVILKNHSKVCYSACEKDSTNVDLTPPTITLNGDANISLIQGETYIELGATAVDAVDGNVSVTVSGSVDTATVGTYTITYNAIDSAGNEAILTREVNVVALPDTIPPVITLTGESSITLISGETYNELGATAVDDRDGNVSVTVSGTVDIATIGVYTITYTAVDDSNNSVSIIRTVTVTAPPAVLTALSISPNSIGLRVGNSVQTVVLGTYSDSTTKELTSNISYIIGDNSVATIDEFGLIEALSVGTTTLGVSVGSISSSQVNITVAKEFNSSNLNVTNYGNQYIEQIPFDATIESYDEKRFCMIAGEILLEDDTPIEGVKVSILNHPEYGSTLTDEFGKYVIPTEGGLTITMRYQKSGYTTIDRNVDAPVQDWAVTKTVTMLAVDSKVTAIDFNSTTPQVHVSTPVNGERGERSTTLVFDGITRATVIAKDGSTRELTNINVRATEFKIPKSMPSDLPIETAYTYCSDLKVDGVSDDESVSFDAPVVMYVDNFLGFDIGEIVPIGYYDRGEGKWKASDNGVVVKLLDTNNDGVVDALDSTGDDNPNDLNGDGSFADEVKGIASNTNYVVGKSYWRGEITHFTPWDFNWPWGPPNANDLSQIIIKKPSSKQGIYS